MPTIQVVKLSLGITLAAASAYAQVFGTPTSYPVGGFAGTGSFGPQPIAIVAADFNGDGRSDLATANGGNSDVSVLLQTPTGGFVPAPGSPIPTGSARGIAAADFNVDGKMDLAVTAGSGPNRVVVLLGNGAGGFTAGTPLAAGNGGRSIVTGDFNADLLPDIAVTNTVERSVTVFLSDGQGGFRTGVAYGAGVAGDVLVAADFNSDGRLDLLAAGQSGLLLFGSGTGTFAPAAALIPLGGNTAGVAAGDYNGDGRADIAVIDADTDRATVLLGNGAGVFTPSGSSYPTDLSAAGVTAGDFTGDGRLDFAVSTYAGTTVTLFAGDGRGGFSRVASQSAGGQGSSIFTVDINNDKRPDVVTANTSGGTASVLLNEMDYTYFIPPELVFNGVSGQSTPITIGSSVWTPRNPVGVNLISSQPWLTTTFGCTGICVTVNPRGLAGYIHRALLRDNSFPSSPRFSMPFTATLHLATPAGTLLPNAGTPWPAGGVGWIATGDFNLDGNVDVATANGADGSVTLLSGTGKGSFNPAPGATSRLSGAISAITSADLNNDGRPDLIATVSQGTGPASTAVLLNNPNGGFTPALGSPFPLSAMVPSGPKTIAAADFNHDGNVDVAVSAEGFAAKVLLGNGFGGLAASPAIFTTGPGAASIAATDVNADGIPDLLMVVAGRVDVYIGNGRGEFTIHSSRPSTSGVSITDIAVADFNSDGRQDLALATTESRAGLALGNGDGTFGPPVYSSVSLSVPGRGALARLAIADFDGSGTPGIALTAVFLGESQMGIYRLVDGGRSFSPPVMLSTGNNAVASATGDLNADGRADLVVANPADGVIRVYLGDRTPTITRLTATPPTTVTAGQPVSLTVAVENQAPANTVFSNPSGTVTFYDGTTAVATVPLSGGAATHPFSGLSPGPHTLRAAYNDNDADLRTQRSSVTANITVAAAAVSISFASAPPGAAFSIDAGTPQTTPFTVSLSPGTHTVAAAATFPGGPGTEQAFTAWSDGVTTASRTITVGSSPATYTANYATQYQLTISASPPQAGSVLPASGTYHRSGSTISILATPNTGYTFSRWTGAVANPSSAATSAVMTSPLTIVANFTALTIAAPTITLSPSPTPSMYGRTITLVATFAAGGQAPTGTVTFYDGVNVLGSAPIASNRTANLVNVLLPSGSRQLRAYYSGDATYSPAGTATVAHQVFVNPASRFASTAIPVGAGPSAVKVADLDGDGFSDLVVLRSNSVVAVLIGNGNSTFRTPATYDTIPGASSIAVGDFNGDAKADLLVGSATQAGLLLNRGDGTLQAQSSGQLTGGGPLTVADFNQDGKLDFVFNGSAAVRLGQGDGSFQTPIVFPLTTTPLSFVASDFNRDSRPDLATLVTGTTGNLVVLTGSGDGRLTASGLHSTGTGSQSLVTGDFNGDGNPDLAVIGGQPAALQIFLGRPGGILGPTSPLTAGIAPGWLAVGDTDGNGNQDLILAAPGAVSGAPGSVTVLAGNGDGTFRAGAPIPTGINPSSVETGDFNRDGVTDFVVANAGSGDITLFTGVPQAVIPIPSGPPVITAEPSPKSVTQGARDVVVAITGRNFCSESQLFWDATPLATTVASETSITARVPDNVAARADAVFITVVNPRSTACGAGGTSNRVALVIAAVLTPSEQPLVVQKVAEEVFTSGSTTPIVRSLPVTTLNGQPPTALQANALTVSGPGTWLRVNRVTSTSVEISMDPTGLGHGTFVGYVVYSASRAGTTGSKAPNQATNDCSQIATVVEFSDERPTLRFSPAAITLMAGRLRDTIRINVDPNSAAAGTIVPVEVKSTTAEGAGGPCWLSFSPQPAKPLPLQTGDTIEAAAVLDASVVAKAEPYQGRIVATSGSDAQMARVTYNVGRTLFAGGAEGVIRVSENTRRVTLEVTSNAASVPFTAACNGCGGWLASIDPPPGQSVTAPRTVVLTIRDTPNFSTLGNLQITGGDSDLRLNITLDQDRSEPVGGGPRLRETKPVLQAFDNSERISSGTWIQIYGENLAPSDCAYVANVSLGCDWQNSFEGIRAPTSLKNVQVLIGGKRAAISFLNQNQINAQVPDDLPDGRVAVQVIVNGVASNEVSAIKSKVSPALLNWSADGVKSYVRAILPPLPSDPPNLVTYAGPENYIQGFQFRPARPGDILTIFAVGCGATTPASAAGQIVQQIQTPIGAPLLASPVQFTFGEGPGTQAVVQGFLAVGNIGLCQLNVTVPNLSPGEHRVEARIEGAPTGQTLYTLIGP